ncbi:MAG: beta-ketoacyl-ACP synthase III [Candidatus Omnitrophota bacterium]
MKSVGIIGFGKYLPKKILTNYDLEKIVDTSDEWITTRTGIKERRIAQKNEAASDLAANAANAALKSANLDALDIDLIIVATITPDMQFPSTACFVQKNIGAKNAVCFDVSSACAGFVYGISIAEQFIARNVYKRALVIGAEKLSSVTDWQDRNTCVLFGDGAGAVILGQTNQGKIMASYLGTDASAIDLLYLPGGGSRHPASLETIEKKMHYIKMQGNELFKLAVRLMTSAAIKVLDKAGLKEQDIDCFIPHQANVRIINAVGQRLKLSSDKIYINIERYGNMSSASAATAFVEAIEDGYIKKGDIVLIDVFGSGLVWGAIVLKW